MTSEARIDALEMALAHAEAAVEDLSETCRAQWAEIDALKTELARLTRSLEAALQEPDEPVDRPPPHW